MRLDNEFVVPRPIDEAWAVLTDVERIAPCMPGAQLDEIIDDAYHGKVKIKVGPVTAQYGGVARFVERDVDRHHVALEAKGKERNGRGLASAVVTADLIAQGDSTLVTVSTDLTISGPLAQFGRGAIAEVSGRLLGQFVDNLKASVLASSPATSPATQPEPAATPTSTATPTSAATPTSTGPPGSLPQEVPAAEPEPVVETATAAPANLLRVAAWPIFKRLIPLLVLVVVVIVVLVVWLG